MIRFLLRRVTFAIPTLFGVATVVFFMVRLIPGDPARVIAGDTATPEQVDHIRTSLGLDQPASVQYGRYLANLIHANLGISTVTGDPVLADIGRRLPFTVELTILATLIGVVVGMSLGILAATHRRSVMDVAVSLLSVAGMSTPTYWLGLNLVVIFAINLRWLPAAGAETPQSVILPALALGTLSIAAIARMTRSSMVDVLSQDYIRTASAKGVPRWRIVARHALPNAAPPILTVVGLQFGLMLGGAVLTESIFAWPGMGRLLVDSIFARDYPIIQGCVLVFSLSFILVNLLVDLLYAVVDPRVSLR